MFKQHKLFLSFDNYKKKSVSWPNHQIRVTN